MNLIYYQGLNCHLACVINIAASLGVNYQDAFGTLWSETDFFYEPKYHIYTSKRIIPNLETVGAKVEVLDCKSNIEAEKNFSLISEGELFVVGMDTFYIPWSLVYQNFHQPHYFFVQKENPDSILCFDPTYNQNNLRLMSGDIIPHIYELSRIHKLPVNPPRFDVSQEAREILRKHPKTIEEFLIHMNKYKAKEQKSITPLIKQIIARINNRYLFQHFLRQYPFAFDHCRRLFNSEFFSKWEAVKNGLYKASIIKNKERMVDEVCSLFLNLMQEEAGMAKEIIITESNFSFETCRRTKTL